MLDPRLVAFVRDPHFWRAAVPGLHVESGETCDAAVPDRDRLELAKAQVREDGYFELRGAVDDTLLRRLRHGMAEIVRQGWPPVFVFVYDEAWLLFDSLRPVVSAFLGDDHRPLEAFWGWSLAPGSGSRGWSPHRDRGTPTLREDGTTELLTLWVALTDATPENGCMYVLPASRDPDYRGDLDKVAVSHLADVRALPASLGTVLGWTQHLLHWGGRSSAWAREPRVSVSMEFQRADVAYGPALAIAIPTFDDRIRMIGALVAKYAHMEPPSMALSELALKL